MTPSEEWFLEGHIGRRVLFYDKVDSTNNLAAALATSPDASGLVVVAREQTAGRGQHGRTWQSLPDTNVLMSVVVFPPSALNRPAILTAWAAVSVRETIRRTTGLEATIKWPNDVLLGGRKVCGILIEQRHGTVVGIGLNVNQRAEDFLAAGLTEATSLAICLGNDLNCRDITRGLLSQLDAIYRQIESGEDGELEAAWREGLGLQGREVVAECSDRVLRGRLLQMTFTGVSLELPGRGIHRVAPEAIHHLRPSTDEPGT